MVQFGQGLSMLPYTVASLRRALFEGGEAEITPAPEYTDEQIFWAEDASLTRWPAMSPNFEGWTWLSGGQTVEGTA